MTQVPIYPAVFCPDGVPRPPHIRHVTPFGTTAEGSPSTDRKAGTLWSPVSIDNIRGPWIETKGKGGGWWVALGDTTQPRHLARIRIMSGDTVFTERRVPFIVPQLLRWHPTAGVLSALTLEYRDYAWKTPAEFEAISQRVRDAVESPADAPGLPNDDVLALAVDLLAINYHISIHELTLMGWMDELFMARVVMAAAGVGEIRRTIEQARAG